MEALWTAAQVEGKIRARIYYDDSFLTIDDHLPSRITKFIVTDGAADRGCPQDVKPFKNEDTGSDDFDETPFAFWIPLYMLDHSGVRISTRPFNDPWDSGCCGFVGVLKEDIENQYGDLSDASVSCARAVMLEEVKIIDALFRGEVYSYAIDQFEHCESCGKSGWELIDACGGFVGNPKLVHDRAVECLKENLANQGLEHEVEEFDPGHWS